MFKTKQKKMSHLLIKKWSMFILFMMHLWPFIVGKDFVLKNSLVGAVNLTKNTNDFDKYKCFGYVVRFDAHGRFLTSDGTASGKNVMVFGADMSSSVHIDNRKKNF